MSNRRRLKEEAYTGKPPSAENKMSIRQAFYLLRMALEELDKEYPTNAAEASQLIGDFKNGNT